MKVLFLIFVLSLSIAAQINVFAPHIDVGAGSGFTVPITVDDAAGVSSFEFDLFYDPQVITPVGENFGCSTENTLSAGMNVLCNVLPAGRLRVVVYGVYELPPGPGSILNLAFVPVKVVEQRSASSLLFQYSDFFNNYGRVAFRTKNGLVTVQDNRYKLPKRYRSTP